MTTFSNRHNGGPALDDDSGWVAIARAMRTHAVVGFDLFVNPCDANRGALQPALAWIDLIMECRFKDGTVLNNGRPMTLRRGQMLGANLWLAQRWNWTPKTVRGFLSRLEAHGMISLENDGIVPGTSRDDDGNKKGRSKGRYANTITVCNYSQYQMSAYAQGQVEGQTEGTSRAGRGPTKGDIYIEGTTVTTETRTTIETEPARPEFAVVAAQGAREGEEDIGHGVYVNGKTIRHASFVINLDAIRMQTLNSGLSATETSTHCQGHALQWAAEIENGKLARDVVPSKIANFLAATITATAHRGAQQSVRIARANRGYPSADPSKPEESTEDRWARMAKIPSKPEVKK